MKRKTKPESFINKPSYPGGKKALDEFVKSNLRYPEEALKTRVEGSVKIAYDVDVYGEVSNAVVKAGIGYGCDEEAVRLVKLLKYEKKKYRGLHVVFHNVIIIHFHLPGKVVAPTPSQVNVVYHYKETNAANNQSK